jgi:hypothetical protein
MKRQAPVWRAIYKRQAGAKRARLSVDGADGRKPDCRSNPKRRLPETIKVLLNRAALQRCVSTVSPLRSGGASDALSRFPACRRDIGEGLERSADQFKASIGGKR